jgi:hypothetical protein
MQILCGILTGCHATHRLISVGAQSSAGDKGDQGAKVRKCLSSTVFCPIVFRPLTLVPQKRGLEASLANEISELRGQPQRINNN